MCREKLGYSQRDELFSKMIREGNLTRDDALALLEQDSRTQGAEDAIASELLEELGLSEMKECLFL
jgi:hypothetical protein